MKNVRRYKAAFDYGEKLIVQALDGVETEKQFRMEHRQSCFVLGFKTCVDKSTVYTSEVEALNSLIAEEDGRILIERSLFNAKEESYCERRATAIKALTDLELGAA